MWTGFNRSSGDWQKSPSTQPWHTGQSAKIYIHFLWLSQQGKQFSSATWNFTPSTLNLLENPVWMHCLHSNDVWIYVPWSTYDLTILLLSPNASWGHTWETQTPNTTLLLHEEYALNWQHLDDLSVPWEVKFLVQLYLEFLHLPIQVEFSSRQPACYSSCCVLCIQHRMCLDKWKTRINFYKKIKRKSTFLRVSQNLSGFNYFILRNTKLIIYEMKCFSCSGFFYILWLYCSKSGDLTLYF